jgi:2-polyprenyl-3-methyl-5-hydroxy-6-metoxy-1,4-benzoquinol methylase
MSQFHESCLLCNSPALTGKGEYLEGNMLQCNNCGFVFAKQIPTIEELIKHYDGYGRKDYLSPITIKRYHEILDNFEPYRKMNNLIDVGCGIGYFAEVAKERGWNVYGTEYTDQAIKICSAKGIMMHQGKLDPNNYPQEHFDIITSFEVIEHINNPIEEMGNFNKILRSGGGVYITTPNFNSISRFLSGPNWTVVGYPEHLSYYTPTTMHALLKKFGFRKGKVETTGFSITKHKISQKTSEKTEYIGSEDEVLRGKMETVWYWKLLKKIVNGFLSSLGVGDAMKVFYIKNDK